MEDFKLTDEQVEALSGLTDLRRRCVLKKLEMNGTNLEAYKAAGGRGGDAAASELFKRADVVAALKLFAHARAKPSIMTREEMLERLTIMARTEITDIIDFIPSDKELIDPETGEIVKQAMWRLRDAKDMPPGAIAAIGELTAGKDGYKFKLHDQRAAMKQLAELLGIEAPKKIEHSGGVTLTAAQRALLDDKLEDEY